MSSIIEMIRCSISFMDLYTQFLPQVWEVLSYHFFKYVFCSFLSLFLFQDASYPYVTLKQK